jgi:hypothetical protein
MTDPDPRICEHCQTCEASPDGWCLTHSTVDGPVYCTAKGHVVLAASLHPEPDRV